MCLKGVQIFYSTFPVPLYIPQIKTCHVSTYLIKLVFFCISLFQMLKINIKKKKKSQTQQQIPIATAIGSPPPILIGGTNKRSLASSTQLSSASRPHNQLIVFFESVTHIHCLLVFFKSHTSFSKSKDQKPTNVYNRSPPEKWPTNILAHPTNHKEPNFQRDPFHFVAWICRFR